MDKKLLLILLTVAFFALATRTFLFNWYYLFGIDSYWFARMARYGITDGFPERDPLYSYGFEHPEIRYTLSIYLPAWVYNLFYEEYDERVYFDLLRWLSSLGGVVGSVFSALIAYTVGGPLAALAGGILAAANPGYVYRSMAGFYEDDALGMGLIIMAVYFLIEGIRREDKKRFLFYTLFLLSSVLVLFTWYGFSLLTYTLLLTSIALFGYYALSFVGEKVRPYLKEDVTWIAGMGAVSGLVIHLLFRKIAEIEAVKILEYFGFLSIDINSVGAAPLLILGLNPLVGVFAGIFGALAYVYLKEGKYKWHALGAFLVTLLLVYASSSNVTLTLYTSDGREHTAGWRYLDPYQLFMGSSVVIFFSSLAGGFVVRTLFHGKPDRKLLEGGVVSLLTALLIILLSGSLSPPTTVMGGRLSVIAATVVEERYGYFFWSPKYAWMAIIPLIIAPLLVYLRDIRVSLPLTAFFALTLYAAWLKLKFNYYLGAPLGIVAGILLAELYRRTDSKKVAVLALVLLSLSMVAAGAFHTVGRIPSLLTPEEINEALLLPASDRMWLEGSRLLPAFAWIRENTEENAPIFNWWGVGHWLSFFTERPLATDNTNRVSKANQYVAETFLSERDVGVERVRKKGYEYIFWLDSYILTPSVFAMYAYGPDYVDMAREYVLIPLYNCKVVSSPAPVFACPTPNGNVFIPLDVANNAGGEWREYNALPKATVGLIELGVYRIGPTAFLLVSERMNSSFMFALLTNSLPELELVYTNGGVKVYKVKG